jgi:Fe-S-cluster-containing hydrogenase component 2
MFCIDDAKCTGCGACLEICPIGAISIKSDKAVIDQRLCSACGSCLKGCPVNAIYEVSIPAVVPKPSPAVVTPHPSAVRKRQSGLATALVSLAPMAVDVISGLAQKWLSPREGAGSMTSGRPKTGAGRQRRYRGRRR